MCSRGPPAAAPAAAAALAAAPIVAGAVRAADALPPTDPCVVRAEVAGIQGLFFKGAFGFDELLNHVATLTPS